ncbi:FAD-dependent oxidoreductase [Clostridium cavendishii]|uniref:FAD-dependent oxidoreductase n=1 Tax=Clostridium cavendishii TaxID=349931 RepID=UPI00116097AA
MIQFCCNTVRRVHASLYDVNKIEGEVSRKLKELKIKTHMVTRITDIEINDKKILGIYDNEGTYYEGDTFVETTGSTGHYK